jgi:uncharacterized protein
MSQENVEVVRRGIEAWNSFFREGTDPIPHLREFCDPDVTLEFSRRLVDAEIYRGYEGARRFLEQLREPWGDFRIEPEKFLDARDKVVVFSRVVGHAKQGRISIDSRVAHMCTVRNGKLIQIEYFGDDRAACLEAAGLSE